MRGRNCPEAWACRLLEKLPVPERVGSKVLPIPTKTRLLLRGRPEAVGEQQEPPRIYGGEVSEWKLHMEGKELLAGFRGMKHVSGNDAQCRLFEAWRKKCSRSSVSRLSASLRTASSARRARRGAWVKFAAAVHARQAQAR